MFQSYALFPHLNVWDNLAFGLKREELSQDKIKARVESMLELVQLTSYAKRKPHQLSGGQQQRVALARSLAKRPSLLLLDEPLGALDKKLREHTQLELVNIIQKVGVTCVMVTHDQHEAMSMAHRIGVMSNGRILQTGSPEEIYDSPSNRFVADFIGNVNLLAGKVLDSIDLNNVLIETEIGNIVISNRKYFKPISEIFLAIRPEKVQLSKVIPLNQPNTFKGIVRNISFLGSYKIFKVLVNNFTIEINISTLHYLQDQIITGDSVYIWWANDSVLMLKD
jgi:putrescine transport system ATP-binding protein